MKKIVFLLILGATSLLLGANSEIMPLKDVKPGMRGNGLTVFDNYHIESFDIEIIDVVYNFFPKRDLIIIKLSGERVNHTGVVSGMSGSPIYINNKLIGALAYRMGDFMKDPIAGVTPIEQMLEIFNKEQVRDQEIAAVATSQLKNYSYNQQFEKSDIFNLLKIPQATYLPGIKPIETPLVMNGLSPHIYEKISQQFTNTNFIVLPGGKIDPDEIIKSAGIKPGSAVAGIIISGDFDISSVGTVTYRDGDRILAFGHPFFNSGPVNIPLAEAKVITTLSSLYASNKFAVASEIIGNIRQDRSTGIMGLVGDFPPMIPVNVKVRSQISNDENFQFKIVNDLSTANMVPVFLWITLLNTLESARLAGGDYALKLKGRIDLEKYPDVVLDNFYSGGSAGFFDGSGMDISEAAFDVVMTLAPLLTNNFENPNIKALDLEFFAQPGKKLAEIDKVFYDREEVNPGDSLDIFIHLRPYQGKTIELKKRIEIPANITPDIITVAVGGADEIKKWELQAGIGKFTPSNFSELVTLLNQKRKNTDITIQLRIPDQGVILHGREFSSLPPSIYQVIKDERTNKNLEVISEKIVQEWLIPLEYEIRGGRKLSLKVRHY